MSENLLVMHCSPTLAGMKTGNLFSCHCCCSKQLHNFVAYWNGKLNQKGVYIKVMQLKNERALIYVYRKAKLEAAISCREIRRFLESNGYDCSRPEKMIEEMLNRLARRICRKEEFPHEIGVFLGYPFEDVKGFIENEGKNYKFVGQWKVYSDEASARELFSKYKKCTDIYCRCFEEGRQLTHLTVAPAGSRATKAAAASF